MAASADPKTPGTWNRYAYVGGDPANNNDPHGTDQFDLGGFDPTDGFDDGGGYAGLNPCIQIGYGLFGGAFNCGMPVVQMCIRDSPQGEGWQTGRMPSVPAHGGDADAGEWRGHSRDSGDAGAREADDDGDVYAGLDQAAEAGLRSHASGRRAGACAGC